MSKIYLSLLFFCFIVLGSETTPSATVPEEKKIANTELPEVRKDGAPSIRIGQLISEDSFRQSYPSALRTLLALADEETTMKIDRDPRIFSSFEDEGIFECPLIYINFVDRTDWKLSDKEVKNLKRYLENGGFIYVDAGINSEFLRQDIRSGQHHSFADWSVTPALEESMKQVFPGKKFKPLPRAHKIYRVFNQGLPDPEVLPETVKEYVVTEKWPQATYSAVALEVNGRIAVLATPIIAMGWGRDFSGAWETTISFRIRESAEGLGDYLKEVTHLSSYSSNREDGGKDTIYTDSSGKPTWVKEPNGTWRAFRYYTSQSISDFAHEFYSRLGVNIMVYALTH